MYLFGYNIKLEFLILIGIIYLILCVHTLSGCCRTTESMTNNSNEKSKTNKMPEPAPQKQKEGFTGANINNGLSASYNLDSNESIDTSKWSAQNMDVEPGKPISQGVKDILNRPKQPIPLPKDELLMFADTKFKPECCPNAYSSSTGCACMTVPQYNYLNARGGNNVPYSEY